MKFSLARIDDGLQVSIRGDISENAEVELNEILEKIEVNKVTFDTAKVELINSLGIRHWINFAQTLRRRHVAVTYQNCFPAIIECCNIYSSFALPGEVRSFHLPLCCKSCGRGSTILLNVENLSADYQVPAKKCATCDGEMESEVDLETYLVFMKA